MKKNISSKNLILVIIAVLGITSVLLFNNANNNYEISYRIENSNLKDNTYTINPDSKIDLPIKIVSASNISTNYELYYLINNKNKENKDIFIGYLNDSKDEASGVIKPNEEKDVIVRIMNTSKEKVNITLGVEGSKDKEIKLTKGITTNNKIYNDNGMFAYIYVGTETAPTKFPGPDDGYSVTELVCTGGEAEWDNEEWSMKIKTTTDTTISCDVKVDTTITFPTFTYIGEKTPPTSFPQKGDENYVIDDLVCTGGTAEWDNDTWAMKNINVTGDLLRCDAKINDQGQLKFTYSGDWTVTNGNTFTNNTISHSQTTVETIRITGASGYKIRLTYTQDSEKNYDYGIFSKLDMNAVNSTSSTNNQGNAYGKTSGTLEYPVITDNREHYIQLMYRKDGSDTNGTDSITVTLEFIK